jgi:hypothetical protein
MAFVGVDIELLRKNRGRVKMNTILNKDVLNILLKAKERINKPCKWCSYWWESEDCKRLGTDGAIWWAISPNLPKYKFNEYQTLLCNTTFDLLAEFSGINRRWESCDRITYLCKHKDVMIMFDNAINKMSESSN